MKQTRPANPNAGGDVVERCASISVLGKASSSFVEYRLTRGNRWSNCRHVGRHVTGDVLSSIAVDIISALFVENIDFRQVAGPATRIDLSGIMFSLQAPGPVPVTIEPHLIVLVRCRAEEPGNAVLETVYRDASGEQIARNVQPFEVEPGKFGYRLVKTDLTFDDYGTIEAHCRIDDGPTIVVPLTLLQP